MNKISISAFIATLFLTASLGYAQDNRYQKEFGGSGTENSYSLDRTLDGGYIAVGYTNSFGSGQKDVYMVKTNGMGEIQWSKAYGGSKDDVGWSVSSARDSGYIVAGTTNSYNSNNQDALIFKTDKDGSVTWSRTFASDSVEDAYAVLSSFFSNGYYVAGFVNDSNGNDGFIAKLGTAGNVRWYKKFGSPGDEEAYNITEDSKGNVLICGITTYDSITAGGKSGSSGDTDAFLAKFDSTGNFKWMKTYGNAFENVAWDVNTDRNTYLMTGWTKTGTGDDDVILIKTDTSGSINSVASYGSMGDDRGFALNVVSGSKYSIVGYTNPTGTDRDVLYLNVSASGSLSNYSLIGHGARDGHWPTDIASARDGGFAILSTTNSFRTGGGDDMYLIKTDDIGVVNCNSNFDVLNTSGIGFTSTGFGSITTSYGSQTPSLTTTTITTSHDSTICCELVAETAQDSFKICQGTAVSMGRAGITGLNYKWTDDKGNVVSTAANPTLKPSVTTTYKLLVSTSDKACSPDSSYVHVLVNQRITFDFARDTSFCAGDSATWITRSNMASYLWTGSHINSTSQAIKLKKADTITFVGFDVNSCVYRDTMIVTVHANPVFNLGTDTTICENTPLVMMGPANMKTYNWNNGDGSQQSYSTTTERKHTLVVVDSNNCTYTDTREVFTNPFSTFSLGADAEFCEGGAHTILGPGALGDYVWNDTASTLQNITVYEEGTYWLKAFNSFGCPYSDTIILTTRDAPTFNLGEDFALCIGLSRYLVGPANMKSYSWASGSSNDSLRITTSGTYVLSVRDSFDCKFTDSITVSDALNPDITLGNDTVICIGDSLLLTPGTFAVYTWSTGSTQSEIYVKVKGTYSVDVEDGNGCKGNATINVDTMTCMSSVESLMLRDFRIYPVPVNKQLNIDFKSDISDAMEISIIDMSGRLVLSERRTIQSGPNHIAVDMSQLKAGAYFVRMYNTMGNSTLKVWVE
mgnify:CR=1 FL=1